MGEMHKSQDLGWEEKWERDVNFGNFYFPLSMSEAPKGGRRVGQTQLCPFLWLGSRGKTRSVVCKESDEREGGRMPKGMLATWVAVSGSAAADGKNKNVTVGRTAAIFVAKNIIMCYKWRLRHFCFTDDDTFDFILGLGDFVSRQKRRASFIAPSYEWKWRR